MNDARSSRFEDTPISIKPRLSALWAAFMFLYVYDVLLSLYEPGRIDDIRSGAVDGVEFTEGVLLGSAVLVTIPALMVVGALMLQARFNRWTNIGVGAFYILVNIGNVLSSPTLPAYLIVFYGSEAVLCGTIIWQAWNWPRTTD